jgi:hypothetical protein
MRNFANFCILVWLHMDAHQYVFFFQNLNILCIFSDRFFDPVFFRFRFPVFWLNRFNDRSGSGNLAQKQCEFDLGSELHTFGIGDNGYQMNPTNSL